MGDSFVERLHQAKELAAARRAAEEAAAAAAEEAANAEPEDPWLITLAAVKGETDKYGVARVTTQYLCDVLELEQKDRKSGNYRRITRAMVSLGWTGARVLGVTRGSYLEQVRGFSKDMRDDRRQHAPSARADEQLSAAGG
jgi:hypothetical protein